jgi:hypothetical protein
MNSIALFEAGGTKTTLLIDTGSEVKQYFLPGFNPNRYSKDFENELVKIDLSGVERIIFYGSGLTSSENKKRVNELLKQFSKAAKKFMMIRLVLHERFLEIKRLNSHHGNRCIRCLV